MTTTPLQMQQVLDVEAAGTPGVFETLRRTRPATRKNLKNHVKVFLGIATRYRRSSILEGIELIRRAIRSGDGKSSLLISPRCPRPMEALQCPDSARAGDVEINGVHDKEVAVDREADVIARRP